MTMAVEAIQGSQGRSREAQRPVVDLNRDLVDDLPKIRDKYKGMLDDLCEGKEMLAEARTSTLHRYAYYSLIILGTSAL